MAKAALLRMMWLFGGVGLLAGPLSAAAQRPARPNADTCLTLTTSSLGCIAALGTAADAQLRGDPRTDEAVRFALGTRYAGKLLEMSRATLGEAHDKTATAYNFLAIFAEKRDPVAAEANYERAIAIAKQVPDNRLRLAVYLRNFGMFLARAARFGDAERTLREAVVESAATGDIALQLRCAAELGSVLTEAGRTDEARETLLDAITLIERERIRSADGAAIYAALGANFLSESRYDQATIYYRAGLAITLKLSGENSREAASAYSMLGEIAGWTGQRKEAAAFAARVYSIRKVLLGARHPATAASRFNWADANGEMGEKEQLREMRAALSDIERGFGPDSDTALGYVGALADHLHNRGQHDEEDALRMRAVAGLEKRRSPTNPRMIVVWLERAIMLRVHDRDLDSLTYFRRANKALLERVRDSSRSPALYDEYARKRSYFRLQVAALFAVSAAVK